MRSLYTGAQAGRGRPTAYDGKANFAALSRVECAGEVAPQSTLYTGVVNRVSLKRTLRLCVVVNRTKPETPRSGGLFSTDCAVSAHTIYEYYPLRCQIEFLFRAATQFTGLNDCPARATETLHFHFNLALAAVGVTKIEARTEQRTPQPQGFSLASWTQPAFNEQLLDEVISKLALEPTLIKNHPQYDSLRTYGARAA